MLNTVDIYEAVRRHCQQCAREAYQVVGGGPLQSNLAVCCPEEGVCWLWPWRMGREAAEGPGGYLEIMRGERAQSLGALAADLLKTKG